jgi:hypothetical protein
VLVEPAGAAKPCEDANDEAADGSMAAVRSFGVCASGVHKQASPVVGFFSRVAAPATPTAAMIPPTTAHRAIVILSNTTTLQTDSKQGATHRSRFLLYCRGVAKSQDPQIRRESRGALASSSGRSESPWNFAEDGYRLSKAEEEQ